jgi:ribosomal protein L24E
MAEVGYTRKGSGFGKGSSGPECVVTGGFGSIEVMHDGQKYYVCCTGCLEYFKDSPDEVIAEYKARKAAEQAEREQPKP